MERGAGRYNIKRLPYFAEQVSEILAGTEQLIIVGSKPPVSFFAYLTLQIILFQMGVRYIHYQLPAENSISALEAVA